MKIKKFNEKFWDFHDEEDEFDLELNCLILFHEAHVPQEEYDKIYDIYDNENGDPYDDNIINNYTRLSPKSKQKISKIINDYIKKNLI